MATNKNPFVKAHYEKIALNKTNEQKLRAAYKAAARDVKQQLDTLKMINPSDSLKKVYLDNLTRDINKSIDSLNRVVQNTIQDAGIKAGNIAVDAGNSLMKQAGLTITGAYSYVPRQEVFNIVSGKLYGQGWNLSQAIWKSGSKMKSDIEKVVGVGLAGNKPIKDIADDLVKYVDPTARKPWDWNKVYPGTATQVDYNAQRLARTMIQHSFQRSLVQSQRYNPFCNGIIWYSVGIHGRTCELCLERDGQVFPVKDLPLDHPNGLCYFEPALWKMNDIADRLGDWVNGKEDAAIETYITKGLGLKKSAPEAKRAITNQRNYVRRRLKQKEKSGGHKVVNGKDISGTWTRRSDKFAFEIEDIINAQGFDGLPRVVSAEEFEAAVKESKFIAQRTYSAESQEILEAYREQLYKGKWYVDCGTGGAQYGQGMYCAADYTGALSKGIRAEMKHYQNLGLDRLGEISQNDLKQILQHQKDKADDILKQYKAGKLGKEEGLKLYREVKDMSANEYLATYMKESKIQGARAYTETFTLAKDAKIISYDDIVKEYEKYRTPYSYEVRKKQAIKEVFQDLKLTKSQEKAYKSALKYYQTGLGGGAKQYEELKNFVDFDDLSNRVYERAQALPKAPIQDMGSFAASKGYDAINAGGHGESGSYTVILNRTKLIIRQP